MAQPVSDPAVIDALNRGAGRPVTDPDLLRHLDQPPTPPSLPAQVGGAFADTARRAGRILEEGGQAILRGGAALVEASPVGVAQRALRGESPRSPLAEVAQAGVGAAEVVGGIASPLAVPIQAPVETAARGAGLSEAGARRTGEIATLVPLGVSAVRGAVNFGGRLLNRMLRPALRPDAAEVRRAAESLNVPLKVTDITASRGPAALESAVMQTPLGGSVLAEAKARQATALSKAADDFLATLGGPEATSATQTGAKATEAIRRTVERTRQVENGLFNEAARLAQGGDAPVLVPIESLKAKAAEILAEQQARLPAQRNAPVVALATQITKARDAVPLRQARVWQQAFGDAIERGELLTRMPSAQAKALFAAVSDDMDRAVAMSGRRDLQVAYQQARTFAENRRAIFADSPLARILQTDPEDVIRQLDLAGGPTGVQRAKVAILGRLPAGRLPDPADVEAWNLVRRHIFEGIFAPAAEGGAVREARGLSVPILSGADLERRLARLGSETVAELLSPVEQQALRNIVTVSKALQAGERLGAVGFTSSTPQGLAIQLLLTGGAGALGGVPGALGTVGGLLVVPQQIAKALTNPRLVAYLASPEFAQAARGGLEAEEALRRLYGFALAERVLAPPAANGANQEAPR
ncbi:MAG TPA: hypothetical protein VF406_21505 [Thermodesulfobacteriota bacterium]